MFSKSRRYLQKQRKLYFWRRSALGRAIAEHIRNHNKAWKHLEKEDKELLASEFSARIFSVVESSDAMKKCRQELVTNLKAYTDLQVLCLTAEDKVNDPIFKDMNRISSDLHNHIYKSTLCNAELDKYIKENGYNESELPGFINKRCGIYRYYAYGFDIVRKNIEVTKDRDWFPNLVQSCMIISESNYRKYLGLPSIVTAIDSSFHNSFIDMTLNAEPDPLLTWEKRFGKSHSATI